MGIKSTVSRRVRGLSLAVALGLTLTTGLCWALVPPEEGTDLRAKEFFLPELYVSSSQRHVDEVLAELPNRVAWENFQAARERAGKGRLHAFIDPRSGTATNMIDVEPLIPGRGFGNQVTLAELGSRFGYKVRKVGPAEVADAVLDFVSRNRQLLGVDLNQLGEVGAVQVTDELWHVNIPQTYHGIPVRHGRLAATLNNGNLVLIGTESWGKVRGLSHVPHLSDEDALAIGFDYADGQSPSDEIVLEPVLEVVPVAPEPGAYRGPVGQGYGHRLVWSFQFRRPPEGATWEILVDAHSGEVIAFQDVNQYATITGGVYPVTSTEICPTPRTCGVMQPNRPIPWADTGLSAPYDAYTNSGGVFYGEGTTTTTLSGLYVDIYDCCGPISNSGSPSIDLGGVNGDHDCDSGGGSPGNTSASRTAFYEVNKLMEVARGWLPGNTWLQSTLTTRVNLNNTCNAYYSGNTINFYRSGGGCRNTGELPEVIDHEWGHGLDYHDTNGTISNPGDAYADIAELYRQQTSCVGYGFWWTSDQGCGMTSDGTGYNADEDQTVGYHCDLDCSGVRDADWDKHADHTPDTPLNWNCVSCSSGTGPCGAQVHCAAAPARQAAWDFVARDLQAAPFNLDNQTAFIIGNKVFYQGSGNVGNWFTCNCGSSSDGCGATNGYMQWLAADDDDGNISNGTPHMTALYNAFNRHEIACAAPTPTNSGCAAGPTGTATLSLASVGDNEISLSWTAVAGASSYWVMRTEGHAGCDYNKALIAETTGLTYTDTEVANGREYYYNVVAVGTSACFGPVSNCVSVRICADNFVMYETFDDSTNPFFKNGGWNTNGSWIMVSSPGFPCVLDQGEFLYYGFTLPEGCGYPGTPGELISPIITGIVANSTLSFLYLRRVEDYSNAPYDKTKVAVAEAYTSSWTTVWSRDSRDQCEEDVECDDSGNALWTESSGINLREWAGKNIQIRFSFDPVDSVDNDNPGWFIDDVKVTGGPPCEPHSGSNTLPTVSVVSPVGGSLFTEGEQVNFSGTASDDEDGDMNSSLHWASHRDGLIAENTESFSISDLSLGNHIITAWVTDSSDAMGSDSVSITIERAEGARSRSQAQTRVSSPSTGPAPPIGPSRSAAGIIPR